MDSEKAAHDRLFGFENVWKMNTLGYFIRISLNTLENFLLNCSIGRIFYLNLYLYYTTVDSIKNEGV